MPVLGVKSTVDHASSSHKAITGAMNDASAGAGAALANIPGAAELISEAMSYAGRLSDAVTEVTGAIDAVNAVTGSHGGEVIDEGRLRAGLVKLRTAMPLKGIVDRFDELFKSKAFIDKVKHHLGANRKPGDLATVREALKNVHPQNVQAFAQLSAALSALESGATGNLESSQAGLKTLSTELKTILSDFGKDVERLVKVSDDLVAAVEA